MTGPPTAVIVTGPASPERLTGLPATEPATLPAPERVTGPPAPERATGPPATEPARILAKCKQS